MKCIPVELGTDDLGRVCRYGLDGCRDGFRNIKTHKRLWQGMRRVIRKGSINIRGQKRKTKESVPP